MQMWVGVGEVVNFKALNQGVDFGDASENGRYGHDGAILRNDPLGIIQTWEHPWPDEESGEPVHYCDSQLANADKERQAAKDELPLRHSSNSRVPNKTRGQYGAEENNAADIEYERKTTDASLHQSARGSAYAGFARQLRLASIDQVITDVRRAIMAAFFRCAFSGKIDCPLGHFGFRAGTLSRQRLNDVPVTVPAGKIHIGVNVRRVAA